jgi:hypothetical protein
MPGTSCTTKPIIAQTGNLAAKKKAYPEHAIASVAPATSSKSLIKLIDPAPRRTDGASLKMKGLNVNNMGRLSLTGPGRASDVSLKEFRQGRRLHGMDGCEANGGILHLSQGRSRMNNGNTAAAFTPQPILGEFEMLDGLQVFVNGAKHTRIFPGFRSR